MHWQSIYFAPWRIVLKRLRFLSLGLYVGATGPHVTGAQLLWRS
jgi:hypothetical protein